MLRIPLRVIEKPGKGEGPVFTFAEALADRPQVPYIVGTGDIDLVCGRCRAVLAARTAVGEISNVVLHCRCGAYNHVASLASG